MPGGVASPVRREPESDLNRGELRVKRQCLELGVAPKLQTSPRHAVDVKQLLATGDRFRNPLDHLRHVLDAKL
jgi:hypothetical protein